MRNKDKDFATALSQRKDNGQAWETKSETPRYIFQFFVHFFRNFSDWLELRLDWIVATACSYLLSLKYRWSVSRSDHFGECEPGTCFAIVFVL